MNRLIMAMVVIVLPILTIQTLYSTAQQPIELSILNESDTTLLITFSRFNGAPLRSKLLEAGELINFGRVYEASVQSYSTLWGYIAPGKQTIFTAQTPKSIPLLHDCLVRIRGIKDRSLFCPFGQWDFQIAEGTYPSHSITQPNNRIEMQTIVDAFPTAKRKIMFTPRYILGLPSYATLGDALEAAAMLESKWNHVTLTPDDGHFASNIVFLIEASYKEFQYGKGDVPLHIPIQMRSPFFHGDPQDPGILAWS